MTSQPDWRSISPDEVEVVREIVSRAGIRRGESLLRDLDGAQVANSTAWILDVKTSSNGETTDLPDGPLPARAFVPSNAAYRGEVIVWLTGGRLSGLEYAWVTDEAPTRWPRPSEMEIIPENDS